MIDLLNQIFISALEAVESASHIIATGGLILDIFGAVGVLAPNIAGVAWLYTILTRWRMGKILDQLKLGRTLEPDSNYFRYFVSILKDNRVVPPDVWANIESITVLEGDVHYHVNDNEGPGIPSERVEKWIDEFRGIEGEYHRSGAWALVIGFGLQAVAEITQINRLVALILLIVIVLLAILTPISWLTTDTF